MTGAEFKAARERLGLTYSELGAILGGIRADTIRRKGEVWGEDRPATVIGVIVQIVKEGLRPDKPEAIRALIAHRGLSVPIPARSAEYAAANGLSDADMAEAVLLFIQAREQEFIDMIEARR